MTSSVAFRKECFEVRVLLLSFASALGFVVPAEGSIGCGVAME